MPDCTDYENHLGRIASSHDQLVFTSQMSVEELQEEFKVLAVPLGRPKSKGFLFAGSTGLPILF